MTIWLFLINHNIRSRSIR